MGFKEITLKLPTDYNEDALRKKIGKELRIKQFTFQIENKSLDARNKNFIHWQLRIAVSSAELKGSMPEKAPALVIPYRKRNKKAIVTGSGPAGFFAGYVLQLAGYDTVIIERGSDVAKRGKGIAEFEKTGVFNPVCNYAFGEGGAGTFSDGKLTSRSKHISLEKEYILKCYMEAGGPEEIMYMTHPHLGSDNLKIIVKNLRNKFQEAGGKIMFETMLEDLKIVNNKVVQAITSSGDMDGDFFLIASGHSAYETFRMMMKRGVVFRTKNFAIGSRMEHSQKIINLAQWGKESLPGVKAAEYRLTSEGDGKHPVYSFCMCPGGVVVPSTAYADGNIVNGMSNYSRNGEFANAACVAGIHPDELCGKTVTAREALDFMEQLERAFYEYSRGYSAAFCSISDFIHKKETKNSSKSSYSLGLVKAPLWELLPAEVYAAMQAGLQDFNKKMKGFETGNLLGLESKTSSPVQVIRENNGLCTGFENLYMIGEGGGYAGGIMSSAADGIKVAMGIVGN